MQIEKNLTILQKLSLTIMRDTLTRSKTERTLEHQLKREGSRQNNFDALCIGWMTIFCERCHEMFRIFDATSQKVLGGSIRARAFKHLPPKVNKCSTCFNVNTGELLPDIPAQTYHASSLKPSTGPCSLRKPPSTPALLRATLEDGSEQAQTTP